MEKCKNCGTPITKEWCEEGYPEGCEHWTPKKPMTNADRIRAMTDWELAEFMADRNVNEYTVWLLNADHGLTATQIEALKCNMLYDLMRWLQQPADGD